MHTFLYISHSLDRTLIENDCLCVPKYNNNIFAIDFFVVVLLGENFVLTLSCVRLFSFSFVCMCVCVCVCVDKLKKIFFFLISFSVTPLLFLFMMMKMKMKVKKERIIFKEQ